MDQQSSDKEAEQQMMATYQNDRIAELQRHTEEIQRLPEMYNERLASLKKRTQELHNTAMTYTSENTTIMQNT